ncbi:MAG: thiamine pyrophosphate-dependent enzyme [Candidatus Caldatribacteriaceae bacterium]
MPTLKELAKRPERITPGHRLCAGCGAPIAVRLILAAADKPVVAANATGCLEVSTTIFPYTAWSIPWIHSAFENAAATIAGVESMYQARRRRGEIDEEVYFVAFGGDGGTYDIGLQALSGALERGHRFLYVCYNNEAYMNTGIQRSSATPLGAWTTTSPVGKAIPGKTQWRKNLTEIVAAHGIPYVAQSVASNWRDLVVKAEKAFHADGPSFINVLASCNRGWRHDPSETLKIMQLAVDCCIWPLYEVEDGVYRLTYKPKEKKPVEEWVKTQGRFRHLLAPENRRLLEAFQKHVDVEWEQLLKKCGEV